MTTPRRNRLALLLGSLLVTPALFVQGCGLKPESMEERFPTLVKHAGWNEQKLLNFVNASTAAPSSVYDLNIDNLPVMPIGAQVDVLGSRFGTSSIFDVWMLHKNGLLDQDASQSKQESTIYLSSSSSAQTNSYRKQTNGGFSLGGLVKKVFFKGSFQYQHDHAYQNSSQGGTARLIAAQTSYGTTLSILTSGIGRYDLTQFLIGPQLSATDLAAQVSPQWAAGSQVNYISDVFLPNDGLYNGGVGGPHAYADLQLLGEMENLFGQALTQYTAYGTPCQAAGATDCSAVRSSLLTTMARLKAQISAAILAFYQNYGDGFASQIEGVNEAVGAAETSYYSSSSNSETGKSWGLSLSASSAGKRFGGEAGAAAASAGHGSYTENGNAEAWNDAVVTAWSLPAGVVDTTAWASNLLTNVQAIARAGKMTVPAISVPAVTPLTPPDLVGTIKDPTAPPDTCFKSPQQWLDYQNEKLRGQVNQDVNQQQLLLEDQNLLVGDPNTPVGPLGLGGLGQPTGGRVLMQGASAAVHQALTREWSELKQLRQERARQAAKTAAVTTDSPLNNVVRLPQMYTSGFTYTPYSQVFAELRPQLDMPEVPATLFAGYPNAIALLLADMAMGELRVYIGFLSNFGASNVNSTVVNAMEAMYQVYSAAVYSTLEASMQSGSDVTPTALASFQQAMLGTRADHSDGALYQAAGSPDLFNYLYHLLDPVPRRIWQSAAGGYVPFLFDGSGGLNFLEVFPRDSYPCTQCPQALVASPVPVVTSTTTPLSLYGQVQVPQSPLYPVFAYLGSRGMNLFFVQTVGAYQVVYGRRYSYAPTVSPYSQPMTLVPPTCKVGYWSPVYPLDFGNASAAVPWSWLKHAWNEECTGSAYVATSPLAYPKNTMWDAGNSFLSYTSGQTYPYSQPSSLSWDYYLNWPETSQPANFPALTLGFEPENATLGVAQPGAANTLINGGSIHSGFGMMNFYGTLFNQAPAGTALVMAPAPVINAFTGPLTAASGTSVTLAWNVSYASTVTLTDCFGNSNVVSTSSSTFTMPSSAVSCTFTLTATNRGSNTTSLPATVTVVNSSACPSGQLPAINSFTATPISSSGNVSISWSVSSVTSGSVEGCGLKMNFLGSGAPPIQAGYSPSCTWTLTVVNGPTSCSVSRTATVGGSSSPAWAHGLSAGTAGGRASPPSRGAMVPTTWSQVDLTTAQPFTTPQKAYGVRLMLLPVNSQTVPGWGAIVGTSYANMNTQPAASASDLVRDAAGTLPGTFDDSYIRVMPGYNTDCSIAANNPACQVHW